MKILYISYDGMTDPLGQAQVIPYLQVLSKKYHHQYVLLSFEKRENYELNKAKIHKLLADANIIWEPRFYTKKPPVLSTLIDIYTMYKSAFSIQKKHQIEIVHCRSYISALVGELLKKTSKVKFLFDMRGFWADERVEGGLWNLESKIYAKIYQFFKKKEKDFLLNANHIISLTNNAKKEILGREGMSTLNISVIPCCVNTTQFSKENINYTLLRETKEKYNINDNETLISYIGSLGTWYMADEMLDFYNEFKVKYKQSRFFFITPDKPEIIYNAAAKKGITKDELIILKAEREQIPTLLTLSKLSIFFIKPSYSKKASSPTKQGELMSMGVPIICNANVGDTDYIVHNYNSGLVIQNFTQHDYKEAVNAVEKLFTLSYESLHDGAIDYFSLEKGAKMYHNAYQSC